MSFTISSIWKLYEHDNQQAFYEKVMWDESTAFDYHASEFHVVESFKAKMFNCWRNF